MKKAGAIFLISAALLFLLFFIFLFLAVRPDPDDMMIGLDLRERGLFPVLKTWYTSSSFRTTLLVSDFLMLGGNNTHIYPLAIFSYYFLVFLLLVHVIYNLSAAILSIKAENTSKKILLLSFSITQAGALYFLCSSRIEVFGWIAATEAHLVPVAFALMACLLIIQKRTSFTTHAALLFCALVIAGGAGHIGVSVIAIACCVYFKWLRADLSATQQKKLRFFLLVQVLLVALISTNPGLWHRINEVDQVMSQAPGYFKGSDSLLLFFQPYKAIGLVITAAGFIALFHTFGLGAYRVRFRSLALLAALVLAICLLMSYAAYKKIGPGRIWFPFDVVVYILLASVFFVPRIRNLIMSAFGSLVCALALVALSWHCYRHIPALNTFRVEYDKLVECVQQAAAGDTLVYRAPPLAPDLVNLVDLSDDHDDEINEQFCRFYNSRAKVSVRRNN